MELIILVSVQIVLTIVFGTIVLLKLRTKEKGDPQSEVREELRMAREEALRSAKELRQEVSENQTRSTEGIIKTLTLIGDEQKKSILQLTKEIDRRLGVIVDNYERHGTELTNSVIDLREINRKELEKQGVAIQKQISEAQRIAKESSDETRNTLDAKLKQLQESNEKKLEEMRQTVDEKLQTTLERRLGESFKLVSERLEAVQRGFGRDANTCHWSGRSQPCSHQCERTRYLGQYQLGAILEQILTPDQYAKNVQPTDGSERVEYAIKLPGKGDPGGKPIWLPIDAKFPKEDYERLVEAARKADAQGVEDSTKALAAALMKSAKDIHDKYISPPATTDFALMFLPTEGLYAEALRQPGLQDELQRKYRVMIAGPTTLSAILSSLRVGFQTLAIEQRAQEIWLVLRAVKTEFGKFGGVLSKVKKQLDTASKTLDQTEGRSRAMERALRKVAELPESDAKTKLILPEVSDDDEPSEAINAEDESPDNQ